ncbi:unnamed protein product [Rotaria sp. Silwood2]|nr:unnamed protein product [Rotaria sp. Silwood2]
MADAIEKAVSENYQSIAFPAIGCGKFDCSISFVAQAMVEKAHRLLAVHPISVSFIIQPERTDIYDEFQKRISLLKQQYSEMKTVSAKIGKGTIEVEMGDITTQKVDAIIGSSSSQILKDTIIRTAGKEVKTAYDNEYKSNPKSTLISTLPGRLACKRIFFLQWKPDKDEAVLRQSIIDFVWTVIQNVISHDYTSIAFPAIGCGKHGCSVDIVVKTMVKEIKNQLSMRNLPLKVKFVVQLEQQNVYDEFCKQVLITSAGKATFFLINAATSIDYTLPITWESSAENKIRFVLPNTKDEYTSVSTDFDKAMRGKHTQIIQIERIQNERWYLQYLAHSRDFKKRLDNDTEKRLYHGCPQQAANLIVEDCFNRSFAGVNGKFYFYFFQS